MITHATTVDVAGATPGEIYDAMVTPTDAAYRRWWPGTHLRFHVRRTHPRTSPIGDRIVMEEYVGDRRLRFRGVVRAAEPSRRILWQFGAGGLAPAWLDIRLHETAGGTRVDHILRLGWEGRAGRAADALLRRWFTPAFADALTVHATTEFPLLAPGASKPGARRPLPFRRSWERAAVSRLGPARAADLLTRMELTYARLLDDRPPFVPATGNAAAFRFERSIAPMAALYRTLRETGDPDPLETTMRVTEARWTRMARPLWALGRLPVPWPVLARLIRTVEQAGFSEPGWRTRWVEHSNRRLAFEISECLYLRVFRLFGIPELAPLACHGDDILNAHLPGVRFVRHGTLARGDAVCDFAFERVATPQRGTSNA